MQQVSHALEQQHLVNPVAVIGVAQQLMLSIERHYFTVPEANCRVSMRSNKSRGSSCRIRFPACLVSWAFTRKMTAHTYMRGGSAKSSSIRSAQKTRSDDTHDRRQYVFCCKIRAMSAECRVEKETTTAEHPAGMGRTYSNKKGLKACAYLHTHTHTQKRVLYCATCDTEDCCCVWRLNARLSFHAIRCQTRLCLPAVPDACLACTNFLSPPLSRYASVCRYHVVQRREHSGTAGTQKTC